MRVRAVLLAAALVLAPLGARAADLVVWWEKGLLPRGGRGGPGDRRRLRAEDRQAGRARPPSADGPAGQDPGGARGRAAARLPVRLQQSTTTSRSGPTRTGWSTSRTRSARSRPCSTRTRSTAPPCSTRRPAGAASTRCRWGASTNHVHVWKSLLERAGFTLADIPKEWEAFWSFWCDQVQPAVRKATGRDDIWGVGLPMSAGGRPTPTASSGSSWHAYEADYVTRDGRLVIDDPEVRAQARQGARQLHRDLPQGLHPARLGRLGQPRQQQGVPGAGGRDDAEPDALDPERAQGRRGRRTTTRTRPRSSGRAAPTASRSPSTASFIEAAVFKAGGHVALAKEFVRFLVGEGWLAHWLDFAGDRFLPPMPALLEQPFWLDPSDPHRMAAAMQFLTRPRDYDYAAVSGDWRHEPGRSRSTSGRRPSTASSPRASAPSRRSTRRSRGSSRS